MTIELSLSIAAIIIAIVLPIVIMYWNIRINTRLQEQLEKSVLRPFPFIDVSIDTSASLLLFPKNFGDAVAHDFTINVRYPSDSKITFIESEYFKITEGGVGEDFVKFLRELVPAKTILPTIHIDAEKEGKAILTRDISYLCLEQKAMISLPPLRQ